MPLTCLCSCFQALVSHRLEGLVVKASASTAEDPEFESRLRWNFFREPVIPVTKIGTPMATLPGAIRSALGLVGPVPVYCDWVRWKVWSATSISVWQHVKMSEQKRPRDTLACGGTSSNQQTRITRPRICV